MAKYIIDFVNNTSEPQIIDFLSSNKCTIEKTFSNFEKVYLVSSEIDLQPTEITESIINDDAEPIVLLNTSAPYSTQTVSTSAENIWWKVYSIYGIDLDSENFELPKKGSTSRVYILDSGIDKLHPEFVNTKITELYSVNQTFEDNNGHGTAIASIIAGSTCGLTDAQLVICKIFDSEHETKQSELLQAFDKILDDWNNNRQFAGLINLSWSTARNLYIENKINQLIDAGLAVVVSAGNNGMPIENVTPACMPSVLTIGSYNQNFEPSNFSNYTASEISLTAGATNFGQLDGWAPGEMIYVARPGGTYGLAGGTSLSAAITSCALAYNFGDALSEHGGYLPAANYTQLVHTTVLSLSRQGMIDLSDEKYSNSVNLIATIFDIPRKSSTIYNSYTLHVPVNSLKGQRLWLPDFVKSYELINPLPDGFRIDNGWIIGEPRSLDGEYKIYESTVRVTTKDDLIYDTKIITAVTAPTFDRNSYPDNDPIVGITLEANCPTVTCTSDVPPTGCQVGTGCGLFCACYAKGFGCYCEN